MAEAIVYCDRCARLIPPSQLGDALRAGKALVCPSCAKAMPPAERAAMSAAGGGPPSPRLRTPGVASAKGGGAPPSSTPRMQPRTTRAPRPQTGAVPAARPAPTRRASLAGPIIAAVAGVPLGIVLVLMLTRSPKRAPAPAPARPDRPTAPAVSVRPEPARPAAEETATEEPVAKEPAAAEPPARRRLREIRSLIDPSLGKYEKIRSDLEAFPSEHPDAPEVAGARRLLAEVDEKYAALAASALEAATEVAGRMASRGDHGGAERAIRAVGERFAGGSWLKDAGERAIEEAVASLRKGRADAAARSLERAREEIERNDFAAARAALEARSAWLEDDRRRAEALLADMAKKEGAEREQLRRGAEWRSFLAELAVAGRKGVGAARKLVEDRRTRLAAAGRGDDLARIDRRLRDAETVESLALEGLRARSGVVRLKLRAKPVAGRVLAVEGRTIRLRPVIGDPVDIALDDVAPEQIVREAGLLRSEGEHAARRVAGYYLARGKLVAARGALAEATSDKSLALDEEIDAVEKALTPPERKEPAKAAATGEVKRVAPRAEARVEAAPKSVIYEPFDYPAGSRLDGSGGTSDMGFEGPWKRGGNIKGAALKWGSLPTTGNCINSDRNYDAYRVISPDALMKNGLLDDGATLWFSLVACVKDANYTNVDINFAISNEPFTFYVLKKYPERMNLEKKGAGVGVGYSRGTVIHATYWLDGVRRTGPGSKRLLKDDAEACGLIVGKITWGEGGGGDKLEIYMPDKNLDPGPVQSEISVDLDQKTFKYLAVQMKEPHTHIDEFRFGATYADVTSDTIAKLLHGLSIEDAVGRPERDGYRLSLGVLKRFAEGHDAGKVTAKKLATLGGSLAVGTQFDASVRKELKAADGYGFAGRMGFASSRRTVAVARRSLKGALAREKPEVVRICIGAADIARNLPAKAYSEALGALVDEVARAGAVPVLHTLPVRTVKVPKDKKQLDAADPATKAVWAVSRAVRSYNDAIAAVGAARKVPVVDAWLIVNKDAETQQRFFSARGGLGREGYAAVNASFLRLYRILERGVAGRETDVPARGGP